jgi:hypothetical protein
MKAMFISLATMMLCLNGYGQTRFADENIERGLAWMFEKGIPEYHAGSSNKEIKDAIRKETGTYLYHTESVGVNEPFSLLDFKLVGMGKSMYRDGGANIIYIVYCFVRDIQSDVVEYWVVKKFDYDHVYNRCIFIVTIAPTTQDPRIIVARSEEYIQTAEVSGRIIRFPEDNLYILHQLDARRWPMSFVNSDLANYQVEFDKEKKPYLRRISERERIRFNRKYRIPME